MEARFARVVLTSTLLICLCLSPLGSVANALPATRRRISSFPRRRRNWPKRLAIRQKSIASSSRSSGSAKRCRRGRSLARSTRQVQPNLGAGGATSFVFDRGEVFGWKMNIQGSRERILDSVLPHEVTHTIFASYFRQPVPRWADEGACTTVEHPSEISKQERNLIQFLKTGRGIPFSQMFAMKEYPPDVMPLYAQGHSLSEWLIESRGRKAFLEFVADGMRDENWPRAVREHYGFSSLLDDAERPGTTG